MKRALVTLILATLLGTHAPSGGLAQETPNSAHSTARADYLFRDESLFYLRQYYQLNRYELGKGNLNSRFQGYELDALLVPGAKTLPVTEPGDVYYTTHSTLVLDRESLEPSDLDRLNQIAHAGLFELVEMVKRLI
jgi:hypothetical protein